MDAKCYLREITGDWSGLNMVRQYFIEISFPFVNPSENWKQKHVTKSFQLGTRAKYKIYLIFLLVRAQLHTCWNTRVNRQYNAITITQLWNKVSQLSFVLHPYHNENVLYCRQSRVIWSLDNFVIENENRLLLQAVLFRPHRAPWVR